METTRCLRQEHQVILRVLGCFEVALARSRESGQASAEMFAPFVEFFEGFADRCHHCKEEDRLFPQLEKHGIPRDGGPIGVMLHEHTLARAHVKAISESIAAADTGDQNALQQIVTEGEALIDLLRNHIAKEDNVLFEMADQVIQGSSLAQLTCAYAQAESENADTNRRCLDLAEQLLRDFPPS